MMPLASPSERILRHQAKSMTESLTEGCFNFHVNKKALTFFPKLVYFCSPISRNKISVYQLNQRILWLRKYVKH
jgi:hypothetical protein